MSTATHAYVRSLPSLSEIVDRVRQALPAGFEVSTTWSWHDTWKFGYAGECADLGTAALVLGPLIVHFDWDIA